MAQCNLDRAVSTLLIQEERYSTVPYSVLEAIWEYLSRHLKIAAKSVFFNFKQYMCFFLAIFIIQTFYGIMAVSTSNNDSVERDHVQEEYSYDMALYNLNEYQHNIVVNYNNNIIYQAAAESFYLIQDDVSYYDEVDRSNRYDVYLTFSEYEKQEAYNKFMKEFYNGTLPVYGEVRSETTALLDNFASSKAANFATFGIITLVLLAVSIFLLILLYNIRINQYKFTYGVYMTVGADFKMLFTTSWWELFMISLVTYIPSIIASTLSVFFIYKSSGFPFVWFAPKMWLFVALFSLVVVTISVISPMRIMSLRAPMSLIITEDNSNLVSSPRRSFNILGKKFPQHYELYSIWRFRKYNIQLLTSAIAVCALFIIGLYLGNIYETNIEFSKPQFQVDYSESLFYVNEGAMEKGDGLAVDASEIRDIEGVTYVEQTGDEKGNFDGTAENFQSPVTEANYISSHTLFPSNRAAFMTNFLNKDGWKATNDVVYKATDAEQILFLEQFEHDGNYEDILSGKNKCIVGDSISNMKKFNIKVGDTIKIATKTGQQKDVDSNATGRSLLNQQLKYFQFEYTEFEVVAVIHDIPSGSLPIYILGEDYEKVTGISPNANLLNVYTDPDLTNDEVLALMDEIKNTCFKDIGAVNVVNCNRISEQNLARDEHNSELFVVVSVLILVISPLLWFFNQILYYRKREKEFNIIQSMGAKESDIRVIYLLGGVCIAVMSLIVSILLSYLASYVVYYFVNVVLPNLTGEFIRYQFYLPWYALVISAVVSVACGFFSAYVPYKSYFKNRFSLENGGSGMKDDE